MAVSLCGILISSLHLLYDCECLSQTCFRINSASFCRQSLQAALLRKHFLPPTSTRGFKSIPHLSWPSKIYWYVSASVSLSSKPHACCPCTAPTRAAPVWLQHSLWLGHLTLRECQPAHQKLCSTCWFSYSLHYHHRLYHFFVFIDEISVVFAYKPFERDP